jgi:hypothetical protein
MMGGQPLVVADRAAVPAEPGEGPLDDPAAGQDLKGVRQAPTDELDAQAQGGRPGDQPASIGGIGPDQPDATAAGAQPVVQPGSGAAGVPAPVEPVYGAPGREIGGQARQTQPLWAT